MPIIWKKSNYGWNGYIGTIRIFVIFWGSLRGDQWKLSVTLPGMVERPEYSGDIDQIKEAANKILSRWLDLTGLQESSLDQTVGNEE